jgi:hypothetical protein
MREKTISYQTLLLNGEMSAPERANWLAQIISDVQQIIGNEYNIYAIDVAEYPITTSPVSATVEIDYTYYKPSEIDEFLISNCNSFSTNRTYHVDEMNDLLRHRFNNCNTEGFVPAPRFVFSDQKVFYYSRVRKKEYSAVDNNCNPVYNLSPVEDRTIYYQPYEVNTHLNGARWENYYNKLDDLARDYKSSTLLLPNEIQSLFIVINTSSSPDGTETCFNSFEKMTLHQYTFATGKLERRGKRPVEDELDNILSPE